jgi:hypothetical protein
MAGTSPAMTKEYVAESMFPKRKTAGAFDPAVQNLKSLNRA